MEEKEKFSYWIFYREKEDFETNDLIWNVFNYSSNAKAIIVWNVFNHYSFRKSLHKMKNYDKERYFKELNRDIHYYFFSKYEYETVITEFPPRIAIDELNRLNKEQEDIKSGKEIHGPYYKPYVDLDVAHKLDVAQQLLINWYAFSQYCWKHRKEF